LTLSSCGLCLGFSFSCGFGFSCFRFDWLSFDWLSFDWLGFDWLGFNWLDFFNWFDFSHFHWFGLRINGSRDNGWGCNSRSSGWNSWSDDSDWSRCWSNNWDSWNGIHLDDGRKDNSGNSGLFLSFRSGNFDFGRCS
jgi:hypothetical protein